MQGNISDSALSGLLELAGEPLELDDSMAEEDTARFLQAVDSIGIPTDERAPHESARQRKEALPKSSQSAPQEQGHALPASPGSKDPSFSFPEEAQEIEVKVWANGPAEAFALDEARETIGDPSREVQQDCESAAEDEAPLHNVQLQGQQIAPSHSKPLTPAQRQHLQSLRNRFQRSRSSGDEAKPQEEVPEPPQPVPDAPQPKKAAWRPNGPHQRRPSFGSSKGAGRQRKGHGDEGAPKEKRQQQQQDQEASTEGNVVPKEPENAGTGPENHGSALLPQSSDAAKAPNAEASARSRPEAEHVLPTSRIPCSSEVFTSRSDAQIYQHHLEAVQHHLLADMESRLQELHQLHDQQHLNAARQDLIMQERVEMAAEKEHKLELLARGRSQGAPREAPEARVSTSLSQGQLGLARAVQEMKQAGAEAAPASSASSGSGGSGAAGPAGTARAEDLARMVREMKQASVEVEAEAAGQHSAFQAGPDPINGTDAAALWQQQQWQQQRQPQQQQQCQQQQQQQQQQVPEVPPQQQWQQQQVPVAVAPMQQQQVPTQQQWHRQHQVAVVPSQQPHQQQRQVAFVPPQQQWQQQQPVAEVPPQQPQQQPVPSWVYQQPQPPQRSSAPISQQPTEPPLPGTSRCPAAEPRGSLPGEKRWRSTEDEAGPLVPLGRLPQAPHHSGPQSQDTQLMAPPPSNSQQQLQQLQHHPQRRPEGLETEGRQLVVSQGRRLASQLPAQGPFLLPDAPSARGVEPPAALEQLRSAVTEDAEVGRAALQKWDSHHSGLVSALCSAAGQVPKGAMDAILAAIEEMDRDVRQLCSRAGGNEQRLQAITKEVLVMRQDAAEASRQVDGYGGRVSDLKGQLERAEKANADLLERCSHWQLQAQTAAEEAAAAVRRAGGVEEGSGALMMQRDELAAQVGELMERVAVEQAGKQEMEELAEQEASSSRELLDRMEEALESYRRDALLEEAELAQQRLDANAAEERAHELLEGLEAVKDALGFAWHRRSFRSLAAAALRRWLRRAQRRLALEELLGKAKTRLRDSGARRAIAAWRIEAYGCGRRREAAVRALLSGAAPALLPPDHATVFRQGVLSDMGVRVPLVGSPEPSVPLALPPVRFVWMVAVLREWQGLLGDSLRPYGAQQAAERQMESARRRLTAAVLREWSRWAATRVRAGHLVAWCRGKAARRTAKEALLAWEEASAAASAAHGALVTDAAVMAGTGAAAADAEAEEEALRGAASWRSRRLLRAWLRRSQASERAWGGTVAALRERFLMRCCAVAFGAWRHAADNTSGRLNREKRAATWRRRRLLEGCWRGWAAATATAAAVEFNSRAFRLYRLLSSCLHAWRHISVGAVRLRLLEQAVVHHSASQALAEVFGAWRRVARCWAEGRSRLERSCRRVSSALLATCWKPWAAYGSRRRAQAAALGRIAARYEAAFVSSAFGAWRSWMEAEETQRRELLQMAERREVRLLLEALGAWRQHLLRRRAEEALVTRHRARLQGRTAAAALRAWSGCVRRQQAGALRTAREQAAAAALGAAFRAWVLHAVGAQESRLHLELSCFSAWRQDAAAARHLRQQGREHALLCLEQALSRIGHRHISALLSDALYGWRGAAISAAALRRRLVSHGRRAAAVCAKRVLEGWRGVCRRMALARGLAAQSLAKVHLSLKRKAVSGWRSEVYEQRHNNALVRSRVVPRQRRLQGAVLQEWRHQVEFRRMQEDSVGILLRKQQLRLTREPWREWRAAVHRRTAECLKEELAQMMAMSLQVRRLGSAVSLWRQWTQRQAELRVLEGRAHSASLRRLLSITFAVWRSGSEAVAALREAVLCRVTRESLTLWKDNAKEQRRERLLAQCSGALEEHVRERLMASAFGAWQEAWRVSIVWGLRGIHNQEQHPPQEQQHRVPAAAAAVPPSSPKRVANKKTGPSPKALPLRGKRHHLLESGLEERRRMQAKARERSPEDPEAVIHRVPTSTPTRQPFQEVQQDQASQHRQQQQQQQLFSELASFILRQQSAVEGVTAGAAVVPAAPEGKNAMGAGKKAASGGAGGRLKAGRRTQGLRTSRTAAAGPKGRAS